jgi:predicted phosphodiesterase
MSAMPPRQVPNPSDDSSRLLIAGDTHGNLDWIRTLSKLAARHGCAGVVQLGDFGFWPDQHELRANNKLVINDRWLSAVAGTAEFHNVWWCVIDGNHDAHELARDAFPADGNGVRPIRDGVLDWADRGAVWEWCGVRFGALGGAVSIDQEWRTEGLSWWASEAITDSEVDALIERAGPQGVDVLLTHDAPLLPDGIPPLSNETKRASCDHSTGQILRAADALDPKILLHGHYHKRYSGLYGSTRLEGLASDEQSSRHGESWVILELPSLAVVSP